VNFSKLIPFLMVPAFAAGCAQTSDDAQSAKGADLTVGAGFDFTAAVGVFEVGGQQLCTAALVDVDAGAQVGGVSASGRQIVMGEACLGKIGNYIGGGVFVTTVGGVKVRTPVAAIDIEGAASTGFAVGILTKNVEGVRPMRPFVGVEAGVGVHAATILTANSHGIQIGAAAEVELSAGFEIRTRCADLRFHAAFEAGVGVQASVGEITGAAAIVNVGGELQFAASINGQCVAHEIGEVLALPIEAADAVINGLADIGAGEPIAVYELTDKVTTVRVEFPTDASELKINAVGFIGATSQDGTTCQALIGACTLRGNYRAGDAINVNVDTGIPGPRRVLFSVN
jgi:hypothetical protein